MNVRIGQNLSNAVVIAKIDKEDSAVIANAVHPARKANIVANIRSVQVCASMAAVGVHLDNLIRAKIAASVHIGHMLKSRRSHRLTRHFR